MRKIPPSTERAASLHGLLMIPKNDGAVIEIRDCATDIIQAVWHAGAKPYFFHDGIRYNGTLVDALRCAVLPYPLEMEAV